MTSGPPHWTCQCGVPVAFGVTHTCPHLQFIPPIPINVMDYGADPTGREDSTEAFHSAIAVALAMRGGGTVHVPKGDYIFKPRQNPKLP